MTYQLKHWAILIALSVVWGTSFFLMKNGLETFTWYQVAAMRISVSMLGTLPLLLIYRKHINKNKVHIYALTGFFGSGLPAFCFTFAQTTLDSGIAGVLNSLTPAFTFALGVLFFAMPFYKWKMAGLLAAITGAIILVSGNDQQTGHTQLAYALPVFLATLSYAMSANMVKYYLQHEHPIALGAVGFLAIGIPAFIYLLSTSFWSLDNRPMYATSLWSIVALSLFGTVIASIVYFKLIQMTDSLFGSLVAYLIPIVALLLGAWDGEKITQLHVLGMAFILLGIYIINARRPFSFLTVKLSR